MGRRYGPRGAWILREVTLGLPASTLVRVTGTNGTGKSTLLRLVAGIDAPGEGRITGRPPRTAYVPERFPALLPFTAVDYLVHLGRVQGLGRAAAKAGAVEWLERFGAGEHARTQLSELSKGTSQKVAVAQALVASPDLLVLDEAWTGLDAAARTELDRAIRERVAAGGTVVFVDHDPRRLAGEADAVYGVQAGAVRPVTAPEAGERDPAPGPRVRITASGGKPLPDGLPGAPATEPPDPDRAPATDPPDPDRAPGAPDTLVLTVDAAHSDALLGALLAASWHIHHLGTEEGVRV